MQLRVFTEPQQGATYDDLLRVARAAEDLGYDAFFRSDHLQRIGGGDPGPGPTESWLTLAALGRETSRIRLGTLLTSATFRLPGMLAVAVAQADQMSGGRVELGLGAGWYEQEHAAYGIPFPPTRERFDRLEEQFEILTGMWATPAGSTYSFTGRHHTLTDCPGLPKPVQLPHPPLIVGGKGPRRTPALAARFADEFNVPFSNAETVREQFDRVRAACQEHRRDGIVLSVAQTVAVGRTDAEVRQRLATIDLTAEEMAAGQGVYGVAGQVVEQLSRFAEVGADRVYCQFLDLTDLDHLELVATEVAPHV
ncbi:MAG: LLM class F420-dependent oxidoreductase [Actinomycetota bacterium]|nr:LLM class F420-dependent oxidoreductase [Actinomycetota bacterium]